MTWAVLHATSKRGGCGCHVSRWMGCRSNEKTVFLIIALNSTLMKFRLKFLKHMGMLIY